MPPVESGAGLAQDQALVALRLRWADTFRLEASVAPIARLRPTGSDERVEVLYWSHQGKWSQIGDFSGITLPLDQALAYIADNSIFWTVA